MKKKLETLIKKVAKGEISPEQALRELEGFPFDDLGFARIDHHRLWRKGFPEIIFGQNKTSDQIIKIAQSILKAGGNLIITRINQEAYQKIKNKIKNLTYNPQARIAYCQQDEPERGKGKIAIISAGTSDIPVAEEAALTCELLGNEVDRIYDVGVAGLHRLISEMEKIRQARVIIVVAGMEGALPSVVAGLVKAPIIAVPTSIGYGASFNGLAALLAMLNSCPGGVAVVNIDNGFGAATVASLINHL
ncbi:MAG: nickel pincer cofactor biosynthesis protein LarB [Candidatus Aminicenantes bacterium]|nr:nickel pincer cofactor biosynthesis protein LarB [Candidatus Aminicenantes bacterium]